MTKLQVMQRATGNVGSHAAAVVHGWRIAIHDEDDTDQGCLGTAMHAVHAIAPICAAAPPVFVPSSTCPPSPSGGALEGMA